MGACGTGMTPNWFPRERRLRPSRLHHGPHAFRDLVAVREHVVLEPRAVGDRHEEGAHTLHRRFQRLERRRVFRDQRRDLGRGAANGTGLVGELVAKKARQLVGIDASAPMLQRAGQKGIYHELRQGDLVAFLDGNAARFDAITCAATLIHFGELDAAFESAATCLRDDGYFVLTLFPNEQDAHGVAVAPLGGLGEAGCFVHGPYYVARVAQTMGFSVRALQSEVHEFAHGKPRMGLVVALRRDPRPSLVPSQSPVIDAPALAQE